MHKVATVRINEGLVPCTGLIILDLHNTRKGQRTALLHNELKRGRLLVELAVEQGLSLCNCIGKGQEKHRRRDVH